MVCERCCDDWIQDDYGGWIHIPCESGCHKDDVDTLGGRV